MKHFPLFSHVLSVLFVIAAATTHAPYFTFAAEPSAEADAELLAQLDKGLEAVVVFQHGDSGTSLINDLEAVVFQLPADSPLRMVVEKKLLDAMETATPDGRVVLCRQLFVIGTDQSIPVLEKWAHDPQTGNSALYALGRNGSPLVDEALQRILKQVSGTLQIGVIDGLGKRRVRAALPELGELLAHSDPQIAAVAARAIGRLGGKEAVAALRELEQVPALVQREVDNGLLRCAELFELAGDVDSASAIYEGFLIADTSVQLRRAGLRGLVSTQPKKALVILVEAIKSGDADLGRFAISLVEEADDPTALTTLAGLLTDVSDANKVLLLRSLGQGRSASVQDAVLNCLADSKNVDVRIAALATLGQIGTSRVLPALLEVAASGGKREQLVASTSLVELRGDDIDAQLCDLAAESESETPVRVAALQTLAQRSSGDVGQVLILLVQDGERTVRLAAISALGSLATKIEIPVLLSQLTNPVEVEDAATIFDACRRSLMRLDNQRESGELIQAAFRSAPGQAKPALLPLLIVSGSDAALNAVYAALDAADPALKSAAIQTLADWPNAAPVETMVKIFQAAGSDANKQVALRGCIRLANLSENPAAIYVRILKQVVGVNDQKQILEGMGISCDTPETLELAVSYMEKNPSVRPNAGLAAVRIANRVRYNDLTLAKTALHRVRSEVKHADVEQRALNVLNEIDKQQGHIFDWLIAGPYKEKGKEGKEVYETPFGPETEDADDVQWKPVLQGQKEWSIDIEQALGTHDYCAAYFRTYVWSSEDQDALFEAGADDAIKVWVNGDLRYKNWRTGGPEPRSMQAEIKLAQGWNELLVKVADHAGGWEFGARIRQPNGLELEGLKYQKTQP